MLKEIPFTIEYKSKLKGTEVTWEIVHATTKKQARERLLNKLTANPNFYGIVIKSIEPLVQSTRHR
jgi:hypothetical protein